MGVKRDKYPKIPMEGHTFQNSFNQSQKLCVLFFIFSYIRTTCFDAAVSRTAVNILFHK